jgi:gamma-glutamylcyclotransferase (GGCT)/AIG2-like uncharacterized protein YtfP
MQRRPYFAYGSNMDPDQMKMRCPAASSTGVVRLAQWDILINARGVATIVPNEATSVEGVLWSVTPTCLDALDHYEGIADGLYRREIVEVDQDSEMIETLVYVAADCVPGEPRTGYLEIILRGAESFGLSPAYQRRLGDLRSAAK